MDINQLLRQAERQQKNLELEVRFRKNMSFFQQQDEFIFKKFSNYNPEKLRLLYTEDGYVNLVNVDLNNKPVYSSEPESFCQDYVDKYFNLPTYYTISAKRTEALDVENDAHISKVNRLVDLILQKNDRLKHAPLEAATNFMLMQGVGLGYQITQLLQKTDIRHLCVIEPHEDIFFASLHTTDWQNIYQHFKQPEHSLKLIIGETADQCFNTLRNHINVIGIFSATTPYVFDHLASKEIKESSTRFFEKLPSLIISMGYFDDEQISLSHTISNYRKDTPILRNHALITKKYLDKPAFVIANGPSLDKAKSFLHEHQNKAVIISCGTALGSLKKIGVKPDFHVEMERTRPVVEWIETSTDEADRKDIFLLGLNTVHPEVFELFEHKGMGMKTNDLGTHYLSQFIGKDEYATNLPFSNPTVGNSGMAFASSLGFKDIYLFGMDFGFSEGGKHHSSFSKHYDVQDEHVEGLNLYKHDAEGNIQLEGNFGGQITTTAVYSNARLAVESLLSLNPAINCYNTSHGVFIRGTTPMHVEEIVLQTPPFDKYTFSLKLFEENFHLRGLRKMKGEREIIATFKPAIKTCKELKTLFSQQTKSWNGAISLLNLHHQLIFRMAFNKKTEYQYSLLKGSVGSFNMALAKCLYLGESLEESLALFNKGKVLYCEFLDHAIKKINQQLLQQDSRRRDLATKVKPAD
ncbi:6-hydroxymethylpterin diphosphokinase MptE-like protein [Motiliproteus sp. MSK22-1]|uniref:motility associated factor glycosyltransferase family protein n=1 Tax=Motiliproteus sp. MSK22-1 TaxID=1897630 RepID=UPI0009786843|nr:6-hydroxymethylpterin diphosphokinase MptE-like protein [Motiliproteus sp. MSK22-1]OMH30020.1 hypothetical protein BGP75_19005 [Motiliproteus sp. MSK22-1]